MEFEWDEAKRLGNFAKHRIDFADAITIWRGPIADPLKSRFDRRELRHVALGIAEDGEELIAEIYTWRETRRRIISARRARRYERVYYQSVFG